MITSKGVDLLYFQILVYAVGLSSLSRKFKDLGAVDQLICSDLFLI